MLYNKGFDESPAEYKSGLHYVEKGIYGYDYMYSFDYASGFIQHNSYLGTISISLEPIIWGNSQTSILISNNAVSFPKISWSKSLGKSRFTFIHGNIKTAEPILSDYGEGTIENNYKYLVGHRWEIGFSDKLQFAFTEMLIYGGRKAEITYFIPTILLYPIQQDITVNHQDNILWFLDGAYFPINGLKLYGTFLIDDLRVSEIFNNHFNNHWGLQAGSHVAGNMFSFPTDLMLEFTAIRPWTYTHRVPTYGTYTHNGRCLGFEHGPNSQLLLIENRWWISTRNRLRISFEQLKWGREPEEDMDDGYDFGNDPNENYSLANPEYTNSTGWLIGDIQTTHTAQFLWEYQLSNIIGLELGFAHVKGMAESVNTMSLQVNVDY
jgi:hypothetical protein